jgi:hypothetical protein
MSRNSSVTQEKNKHSRSPILKIDLMPKDEGEVLHTEAEAEAEGEAVSSTTTKQQWSVLSAICLDTFNMSVQAGIKKLITLN